MSVAWFGIPKFQFKICPQFWNSAEKINSRVKVVHANGMANFFSTFQIAGVVLELQTATISVVVKDVKIRTCARMFTYCFTWIILTMRLRILRNVIGNKFIRIGYLMSIIPYAVSGILLSVFIGQKTNSFHSFFCVFETFV